MLISYRQIIDQCAKEYKKGIFRDNEGYFPGYFFPNGELATQGSIEY